MKIDDQVAQMRPRRYTMSQAAELVGRDRATLKRWKREGIYRPSDYEMHGKLKVALYTQDDINAMKKIAKETKPGRKPLPRQADTLAKVS